jgi:1,4-dihydroxy-2-naphthoate octaprenyltransferase
MKKWLLATRPWSFTASVIPLTLGAALAWASDAAHAGLFLLTLLGGVAVQTGTNMLNTYGDYRSGVDTEASAHGESLILLGLISPEAVRRGGLIALCVAFAVGIVLGFACGWPILAFGLVGIAGGYGYTSGFWPHSAFCRCPDCCAGIVAYAADARDPASARIRTRIAGRRIREAPFPVRAAAHCRNTAAARP